MPVSPTISIYAVLVAKVSRQTIYISLKLFIGSKDFDILTLLDSGAGGNFVHTNFAKSLQNLEPLAKPIQAFNVDGTLNTTGTITHSVAADVLVNDLHMMVNFLVTGLGRVTLILEYPWLQTWNPDVDWHEGTLRWHHTTPNGPTPSVINTISGKALGPTSSWPQDKISPGITPVALIKIVSGHTIHEELYARHLALFTRMPASAVKHGFTHDVVAPHLVNANNIDAQEHPYDYAEIYGLHTALERQEVETWIQADNDPYYDERNMWIQVLDPESPYYKDLPTEAEVWIRTKISLSQELAIAQENARTKKTVEEMVPPELHDYLNVFSETKAARFPSRKPYDHKIELKPGFKPKRHKLYSLTPEEDKLLQEFLTENLAKGYICPSTSDMASSFFFVMKKDGKKRPCQDYQYINEWTIKNSYPLPRINDLMDKLQGKKLFTKMDVQWGYN